MNNNNKTSGALLGTLALLIAVTAVGGPVARAQVRDDLRVLRYATPRILAADLRNRALKFDALGQRFDLALERNERIVVPAAAQRAGVEALRGTLRGAAAGTWVRITQTPAGPFGMIFDGQDLYGIEPASELAGRTSGTLAANPTDAVIYRLADTLLSADEQRCGVVTLPGVAASPILKTTQSGAQAYQLLATELQAAAAQVATRELTLGVVGDYEFSQLALPNGLSPEASLVARMNIVDGIYSAQVGVKLNARISVFSSPNDPFSEETVAASLLDEVGTWRSTTPAQSTLGLTHLVTGRDFEGVTVGIGFVGSLCSARSGVSASQGTLSTVNAALVIAHELGHNFGAYHDGTAGRACESVATTFLMSPSLNGSQTFSACSVTSMQPSLDAAACMRPLATAADADLDLPIPPIRARGSSFDYSFDVRSVGGSTVEGVVTRIMVPAALTLNAVSSGGAPCTLGGDNTAQCALGSIAAGARRAVTLNLTPVRNGIHVLAASLSASNDAVGVNDAAQMNFRIDPPADLAVTTSAAPERIQAGASTEFTATARLLAGDPVTDARLTFSIPSMLTLAALQANSMGCTRSGSSVTCVPSPLSPGVPRSVVLTLAGTRPGAASVTVGISSASVVDGASANNSATSPVTVDASADLSVELSATPLRFRNGETSAVTARVAHVAGDPVTDAAFSLTLPPGLSLASVDANSLGCAVIGGALSCNATALSAGQSQTLRLSVRGSRGGAAMLLASARSASTVDPVVANNSATVNCTVDPVADLGVRLGASPAAVTAGGSTDLTATVTNNTGDAVPDAALTWTLPAGVTVTAVSSNGLGCALQGTGIACAPRPLAAGASAGVTATVAMAGAGSFTAAVAVRTASVEDPVTGNNAAETSLTASAARSGGSGGGGYLSRGSGGLAAVFALWLVQALRRSRPPGVRQSGQCPARAARCGTTRMQPAMKTSSRADAAKRLRSRPPALTGLSRKSPTTAPSGRVSTKAAQNSNVCEIRVQK